MRVINAFPQLMYPPHPLSDSYCIYLIVLIRSWCWKFWVNLQYLYAEWRFSAQDSFFKILVGTIVHSFVLFLWRIPCISFTSNFKNFRTSESSSKFFFMRSNVVLGTAKSAVWRQGRKFTFYFERKLFHTDKQMPFVWFKLDWRYGSILLMHGSFELVYNLILFY